MGWTHPLCVFPFLSATAVQVTDHILSSNLISVLVSGSFVPCVPEIARELGTTGSVIKYVYSVDVAISAYRALCIRLADYCVRFYLA